MSEEIETMIEILSTNPKVSSMTPEQRVEWDRKLEEITAALRAMDASEGASALLDTRAQHALRDEDFETRMAFAFIHTARHMDPRGLIPPEAVLDMAGPGFVTVVVSLVDAAMEQFGLTRLPEDTKDHLMGTLAAAVTGAIIQTWYAASNGECLLYPQHQEEEK